MISPSEAIEKVSRVKGLYAYESDYEALDFAICAIEKQIPKEAYIVWGETFGSNKPQCPVCLCPVCLTIGRHGMNYCWNCGQALSGTEV